MTHSPVSVIGGFETIGEGLYHFSQLENLSCNSLLAYGRIISALENAQHDSRNTQFATRSVPARGRQRLHLGVVEAPPLNFNESGQRISS